MRRLALALALTTSAFGQQPQADQQKPAPDGTQDRPGYSLHVNVPLVTLDVAVQSEDGMFISGLEKDNFRILEDGVPQTITSFSQRQSPASVVLLVEYSVETSALEMNAVRAMRSFVSTLKTDDWAAVVLFDKHTRLLQDFTKDKRLVTAALDAPNVPLSREVNLFDALYETLTRLETVAGPKFIILISNGQDTLSVRTLDEVLNKIRSDAGTIIYSVDTGKGLHHLQAENQMGVFAHLSGGKVYYAFSLRECADVFRDIGQTIRDRYSISYRSTHKVQDGSWHRVQVQVTPPPGVKAKYQVIAREGYRATPVKVLNAAGPR